MKNANLFWYLKNVDLFQGLHETELRELATMVDERLCHKKTVALCSA